MLRFFRRAKNDKSQPNQGAKSGGSIVLGSEMKKTMNLLVKLVIAAFLTLFSENMNPQLQVELTSASQDILVIKNGTVIDGTGVDPIENGAVIIRGNHVHAVGKAADLVFPSTADIIDAQGQTILPGIINSHVHHAGPYEQRRRFLEAGVTSVCDLGSPQEEISLFQETQGAEGPTARGFYAGRILTAPGGYPDGLGRTQGFNYEVSTPLEARVCGQEKELGTLEQGKLADIIITDGNPLTDIEAFSRISHVIIDGKPAVPNSNCLKDEKD